MSVFTVNRKQLQLELGLLVSVLVRKPTIPVLESVRLEWAANLTLTASSLDITMVSAIELPAVLTPEHDTFCLPLRELHRLVSLFESEEVAFSRDGKRVLVQGGKSKHKLPFWEVGEYPEIEQVARPQKLSIEAGLIPAISRVVSCAAVQDNFPLWQYGVEIKGGAEGVTLAATDNYRLGVGRVNASTEPFTVVVPATSLRPLITIPDGPIDVEIGTTQIAFISGTRTTLMTLMDYKFPNWEMLIPDNPYQVQFNGKQLDATLKRMAVTRDDRPGSGMKFTFASDGITVHNDTTKGESVEQVDISGNLNGSKIDVGLNPDYLHSYLAAAGETVNCSVGDAAQLLLTEPDCNFQYVLMRMRL